MEVFNIDEAQAHLSWLLDCVARGEEVIIAKRGRPVAKLVRVVAEPRRSGRLKGRIRIGPAVEEPLPEEIQAAFHGEGE